MLINRYFGYFNLFNNFFMYLVIKLQCDVYKNHNGVSIISFLNSDISFNYIAKFNY